MSLSGNYFQQRSQFQGRVPSNIYPQIIKWTQIVSVDLLIKFEGRYLLGLRKNKPAQGLYFVPGGKVYNNELVKDGVRRVALEEIGLKNISMPIAIGAYEHIYDDHYAGDSHGTHYIVFAHEIELESLDQLHIGSDDQHSNFVWMTPEEILSRPDVHPYNKYYFTVDPPNRIFYQSSI